MFKDYTIDDYTALLSSDAPAPGGGSALAVVASNAVALTAMAVNVTVKKLQKQNLENKTLLGYVAMLEALRCEVLSLSDSDAQAFDGIITAMRLPKSTEEEISARKLALQQAYVTGATVPVKLMTKCAQAYKIALDVIRLADKFVVSDAIIGAELLKKAVALSMHHVTINTDCITDEQTKNTLLATAQKCLAEVE